MALRQVASKIPVDQFDPNVSLGSDVFYMTYGGATSWAYIKLRTTRSPAIADFNHLMPAKLFEWDPSGPCWKLIAYKDPTHPPQCDRCALTTFDHPRSWNYNTAQYEYDTSAPQENQGRWAFLRKGASRKLVEPLTCMHMCQVCREDHA